MARQTGIDPDDCIDTQLREEYYRGSRDLEEKLTTDILEIIRQFLDRRFNEGRRTALRDAQAQDAVCVRAVFRVDADLDQSLCQGIFQPGQEYDAWIRFSNGNSEVLSSRWPDARGMAIKIMNVDGPRLSDDEQHTQDFILANNPVFFIDDLQRYKDTLMVFHSGGLFKQYLAIVKLSWREKVLAVKVNTTFITNPLFCQYWSMTPYRLGTDPGPKIAVKFMARPRIAKRPSFPRRVSKFLSPGFSLKEEMQSALSGTDMWFDFYLQRYVDDDRTPIEDSTIEWMECVSKPQHIAKIVIPAQQLLSAQRNWFCDNLSFNSWHCLESHKPLGAVNRVRKRVYVAISQHRHGLNRAPMVEPTGAPNS